MYHFGTSSFDTFAYIVERRFQRMHLDRIRSLWLMMVMMMMKQKIQAHRLHIPRRCHRNLHHRLRYNR